MRPFVACWLLLFITPSIDAQVVLSRRVYVERGRSWRQLWIANGTRLQQVTRSARDHAEPVCSRDGASIYFVSDADASQSLNAYAGAAAREIWVLDRQTGRERLVFRSAAELNLVRNGTMAGGGALARSDTELIALSPHTWRLANPAYGSAVSPDGRSVAVVLANANLVLVDSATGKRRMELGKYEAPAWSADGSRIAAIAGNGIAFIDSRTGKEAAHEASPKPDVPLEDLAWSADGRYLLAGVYGEEGGSGDPQRDYFLLNIATHKWSALFTAQKAVWTSDSNKLLYLRPVKTMPLAPGSKHQVWTAQLAEFDLARHSSSDLSSGVVLNDDLAACGSR